MSALTDRIESVIRAWSEWSRAERRRMDEVVAEILDHVRNGGGNSFVRAWCAGPLAHALENGD